MVRGFAAGTCRRGANQHQGGQNHARHRHPILDCCLRCFHKRSARMLPSSQPHLKAARVKEGPIKLESSATLEFGQPDCGRLSTLRRRTAPSPHLSCDASDMGLRMKRLCERRPQLTRGGPVRKNWLRPPGDSLQKMAHLHDCRETRKSPIEMVPANYEFPLKKRSRRSSRQSARSIDSSASSLKRPQFYSLVCWFS